MPKTTGYSAVIIKRLLTSGCVFLVILAGFCFSMASRAEEQKPVEISNNLLKVTFSTETGLLTVRKNDGTASVRNAFSAVQTHNEYVVSTDEFFERRCETGRFSDAVGSGKKLEVYCDNEKKTVDLGITVKLYDGRELFTVDTDVINVSDENIGVIEVQPLIADSRNGGGVTLGGVSGPMVSTEGYFFTDPGTLASLDDVNSVGSWWNITVYGEPGENVFLCGFITKKSCESYFRVAKAAAEQSSGSEYAFSLESHCPLLMPGRTTGNFDTYQSWSDPHKIGFKEKFPVILKKSAEINSDVLAVLFGSDPHSALEEYAGLNKQYNQLPIKESIPTGWSTWPYYYWAIDEEAVLKNADFIAENLKEYGMEYVQIDGGWQVRAGQWQAEKELFPHGMKWLADQIHKRGLKAALWLSPFEIDETSEVFKEHKDWLIRNRDGSLFVASKAHSKAPSLRRETPSGKRPKVYALDVTNPDARQWLYGLFKKITDDWGYDFVKIDWGYTTYCMAEVFQDKTKTKAQAYRLALQTIRDGIGPDRYFMNGGPHTQMGIIDSARISMDSAATWENISMSNGQARCIGRRYYMHQNLWTNDPDMLMVRSPLNEKQLQEVKPRRQSLDERLGMGGFSYEEARSLASVIAFSGGQFLNGDDLTALPAERVEILKKVLPVYPQAAKPLDRFRDTFPEVFKWNIEKDFGSWQVVGVFNWSDTETKTRKLAPEDMGLAPEKDYLLFDFWHDDFRGELKGSPELKADPGVSYIMRITEKKSRPQLLSTNRHISQGAVDLVDVKWDENENTLSGISKVIPGTEYVISFYVPLDYRFKNFDVDAGEATTSASGPYVIKLRIKTSDQNKIKWSISFAG